VVEPVIRHLRRAGQLAAGLVLAGAVQVSQGQRAEIRPGSDPTNAPYWHVAGEAWGTPAADSRSVYFLSRDRSLIAFDIVSGAVRWRRPTGGRGRDPAGWAVRIASSYVLAADGMLQAFDRLTGEPRWQFAPPDDGGAGEYLGAVAGDRAYVGSPIGRVYAVDVESGALRWRTVLPLERQVLVLEPVTNGALVIAPYRVAGVPLTGGVVALDAVSGAIRWRTEFPRPPNPGLGSNAAGNAVIVDDVALAATSFGAIYAFDLQTGEIRWSLPQVRNLPGEFLVSPDFDYRVLTVAGRRLIAGSLTGAVTAYDLDTRRELWRNTGQRFASVAYGIATDDRCAYVPYLGSRLVAIDLATGAERWRAAPAGGGFSFPPLAASGRLFVASASSGFYALRR
jgi:outer membrane protein assembly factor BamB